MDNQTPNRKLFPKKYSLPVLLLTAVIAAVVTFQATYVSMRNAYAKTLREYMLEESNSVAGKLRLIDSRFRELYVGELDDETLMKAVMNGYILGSGDRYGQYMTAEEFAAFSADLNGEFEGIGVSVTENKQLGGLEILSVYSGSPAEKAGMQQGDVITAVGDTQIADIGMDAAIDLIKGKSGTSVTLTWCRGEDYAEKYTADIERGSVTEQTVMHHMFDPGDSEDLADAAGKIGVITVLSFDRSTPKQFSSAIAELREQGAQALVFDVRNNPGGDLDCIVEILDSLLPEGPIIRIVSTVGEDEVRESDKNELDMPMAVLVNGGTASAAELFSSALQDYGKAKLVGTLTYGKGCMQRIVTFPDGSALRVTTNLYNPPFSDNYDGIGITPDLVVELDPALEGKNRFAIADSEDNQLCAAVQMLAADALS